jgi:translation initiation factor IF-2
LPDTRTPASTARSCRLPVKANSPGLTWRTLSNSAGRSKQGDSIVAGKEYGRIRNMLNEAGKPVQEVGPSMPVSVLGLSGTPSSGDEVLSLADERKIRELAEFRHHKVRDVKLARQQAAKLEDVFSQMESAASESLQILL